MLALAYLQTTGFVPEQQSSRQRPATLICWSSRNCRNTRMPSSMSWPNGSFTAFRIPKETKYEIVQLISCSLCQLPLIDQLQHWNHLSSYIIIQNHTSMFLTRFCFSHLCLIQQPARQPRQPVAKVVGRLQVLGIHVYMSRGEQVNILLWLFMTDLTCWNLPLFSWQLGGCSPETGILSLHKFFIPIFFHQVRCIRCICLWHQEAASRRERRISS